MAGKNTVDESTQCTDSDLSVARKVQAAMIPQSIPVVEGLDIRSLYLPCRAVGGDLFDVVRISENCIAFLIFDVTGFGISSALISAMAKVSFTNHLRTGFSPRAIIELVNNDLIKNLHCDFYVTAFLGYLDLHDNRLTYCNAGHSYPIVYRKNLNNIEILKTQGTFLGILDDGFFEEQSVVLNPGDCLLLFTDGLYQLFSNEQVEGRRVFEQTAIEILSKASPEDLIAHIKKSFDQLCSLSDPEDDITTLSIEVQTQSRKEQIKAALGFRPDDPVYVQFLSYFEEMDRAVSVVLSSMDSCGYADDAIRRMKITLTELLVNAISHGNGRDFSKKVIMGHIVTKRCSVVSIMDEGSGFDPLSIPDPTLPENLTRDCGRGLFIVRHYVDSIAFNSVGNRVTITKLHG